MSELEALFEVARQALRFAQPRYSGFSVGVAVQADDGRVFTGANFENPSLMMSICAEKLAVLKAISEGANRIRRLAIVSSEGQYCYPCGCCRQLIFEYCPEAEIYLLSDTGIKKYHIKELLPHGFRR